MYLSEPDKQKIIEICKRNYISYCAVFGSFARGEANEDSDIDLLVKFSKPVGYAFFGVALELEDALGRKVDLATDSMIGPHLRPYVMADLEALYEKANDRLRLRHILDAISQIGEHLNGMEFEEFRMDEKTLNAVLWQLSVIGEAAANITVQVKEASPHVQWQSATAARNRLVHGYFDVDPNIIWDLIENDLPFLERQVEKIIEELEKVDETD